MRRPLRIFAALVFWSALVSATHVDAASPPLLAGAHATDITPTRFPVIINGGFLQKTAMSAVDPLFARCLVLAQGETKLAIMVVDSCMLPRELLDDVKEKAAKQTGLATDRILISATHTHSAPAAMGALGTDADPAYQHFLVPKLVECLAGAAANLQPAKLGSTSFMAPEFTHCRRWILRSDKTQLDPFGERTVRANMHPGYQNPDFIGPSGPTDPECSLVSVRTLDDQTICILANFSMHYVGATAVSADYFGVFSQKLAELAKADGRAPIVLMSQGTSGDQQWMDYGKPQVARTYTEYGEALATKAFEALPAIKYDVPEVVSMVETTQTLKRRLPSPERTEWARKIVADMNGRLPRDKTEVYAREQLFLLEEPERELKLQAIRIGELGIAAIPNEVFAITGLQIKAASPLARTFVIELANGSEGYIPPPEQHALGGYTTWPARTAALEVDAEPAILDATLTLLESLTGRARKAVK